LEEEDETEAGGAIVGGAIAEGGAIAGGGDEAEIVAALAAAAAEAWTAPEPELIPIEAMEHGGGTMAEALELVVVIDPTVVVVFEPMLIEELELDVPKEEVGGNTAVEFDSVDEAAAETAAELIFAAESDENIAAAASVVEVALVDELATATVEFDCGAADPATLLAGGAAAG